MSADPSGTCMEPMFINTLTNNKDLIEWIPVEVKLPMEQWRGERVIDEVLVTLRPNDFETDLNVDDEVCIMTFCSYKMCFMINFHTDPNPLPYEDYIDNWHIVAWAKLPKPYKRD